MPLLRPRLPLAAQNATLEGPEGASLRVWVLHPELVSKFELPSDVPEALKSQLEAAVKKPRKRPGASERWLGRCRRPRRSLGCDSVRRHSLVCAAALADAPKPKKSKAEQEGGKEGGEAAAGEAAGEGTGAADGAGPSTSSPEKTKTQKHKKPKKEKQPAADGEGGAGSDKPAKEDVPMVQVQAKPLEVRAAREAWGDWLRGAARACAAAHGGCRHEHHRRRPLPPWLCRRWRSSTRMARTRR